MGYETIGSGLKTVLSNITGLRIYAPNELPDSINPPVAVILPGETNYVDSFANDYSFTLRVIILLSKQDSPSAFNKILDYIEPTGTYSVVAKVNAAPTLNSTCAGATVLRNLGVGTTPWGNITYLSTEFEIGIYA